MSRLETDVLVVGAGPGGSATAYHLARHGVDVTIVERSAFPREKVCGDGLTPRGVAALLKMGVDPSEPGFERVKGLRVHSRDALIELPFPELRTFPDYGLVRTRHDFDALLVQRAQKAGARLMERTEAIAPIISDGWVRGATIRAVEGKDAEPTEVRARFVIASDGAASRFAKPAGIVRDESRPLGIAARRYYRTDYHPGPWLESWLDLWEGDLLLPGYGWLFPVAGGTINLGAGLLNTFKNFKDVSAQRLFNAFASMLPPSFGISEDTAEGRLLSGPLPMSFNRVAAGGAGHVARRRRGRRGEPVQRRRASRTRWRPVRSRPTSCTRRWCRTGRGSPCRIRRCFASATAGTSRSAGGSPARSASPRSWAWRPASCFRVRW